jgi:hypothetical protein
VNQCHEKKLTYNDDDAVLWLHNLFTIIANMNCSPASRSSTVLQKIFPEKTKKKKKEKKEKKSNSKWRKKERQP